MTEKFIQIADQMMQALYEGNGALFAYDLKDALMKKYDAQLEIDIFNVQQQLIDLDFIDIYANDGWVRLRPEGFSAAKMGLAAYLKKQERIADRRERKEIMDLKNLEFYAKTKYWPYIVAGLSFIVSIVLPLLLSR